MNSDSRFPVFFSLSLPKNDDLPNFGILIWPSHSTWNDFGYRTSYRYKIIAEDISIEIQEFKLAFLSAQEKSSISSLEDKLNRSLENFIPESELPQFFTMHTNLQEYRFLVRQLGVSKAEKILLSLNDLVANRRLSPIPPWLPHAELSPAFAYSFVRNSEAYFTYKNAGSILAGVMAEDLGSVANRLRLEFKLEAFDNPHVLDFKFVPDALIPKRIAVLIGKNGVGKSQGLRRLIEAALESSDALSDGEKARPQISRIIAVSTPGETNATFPTPPSSDARINYKRLSAAPFDAKSQHETLPDILLQLARNFHDIGAASRWEIFEEAIADVFKLEKLFIVPGLRVEAHEKFVNTERISITCLKDLRRGSEKEFLGRLMQVDMAGTLRHRAGDSYCELSSGQLSFIRLLAQLCMTIENGTLLLIDEPETHLHPNLLIDFMTVLNRVLSLAGSVAIIATHSVHLVREVPTSQVHIIRTDENNRISISQPRLKTFGADISSISHFVFGDEIVNRLVTDTATKILDRNFNGDEWLTHVQGDLSSEALELLKQVIAGRRGDSA